MTFVSTDTDIGTVLSTFAGSALAGQRALVAGAASGMGRATAIALAASGAEVVVSDIREEALEETATAIERQAGRAVATLVVGDLSDADAVARIVAAAVDALGGLTTLVNCAGIAHFQGADGADAATQWRQILDTNLTSAYLLADAVRPHLRAAGGGSITNVGSVMAKRSYRGREGHAYSSSKAGIIGLTRSLALALGPDRVRVNAILPGLVRTRLATRLLDRAQALNEEGRGVPVGRVGEPVDIAACAVFLASDAGSFITGAEIVMDGGTSIEMDMTRFLS
jgi:NAD(P)-dependent dehydrogenase (short-subunit alcohol dehydrogenase family)